jgi:hypothetical protein
MLGTDPGSGPGEVVYVNRSVELVGLVPAGVVTVTSTVPVPAGDTAVIEVDELTTMPVALAKPNLTAVAPVKPLPVIVTELPPAVDPEVGLILETVGR